MMTVCGVFCETECHAFGIECAGCHQLRGAVSWTKFIGKSICPIYQCVLDRGFPSCADCPKLPCQIWLVETKNPDLIDAEYEQEILNRISNLKQPHPE